MRNDDDAAAEMVQEEAKMKRDGTTRKRRRKAAGLGTDGDARVPGLLQPEKRIKEKREKCV